MSGIDQAEIQTLLASGADRPPDELVGAFRSNRAMIVAGAGVSAYTTDGAPAATWKGLFGLAAEHFQEADTDARTRLSTRTALLAVRAIKDDEENELDVEAYLDAADRMHDAFRLEFRTWLVDVLDELEQSDRDRRKRELIDAIDALDCPIMTTNYDRLIEFTCGRSRGTQGRKDGRHGDVINGGSGGLKDVLHIHGHVGDPDSIVLNRQSYEELLADADHHDLMAQALSKHLLFVGCGDTLRDPNFEHLRRLLRRFSTSTSVRAFRLSTKDEVGVHRRLHADAQDPITVVCYGSRHDDLPSYLRWLTSLASTVSQVTSARQPSPTWPHTIITAVIESNSLTVDDPGATGAGQSPIAPDWARQETVRQLRAALVAVSEDADGSSRMDESSVQLLGSHLLMYFGPALAHALRRHDLEHCGLQLDIRDSAQELLPWECMYSSPTAATQTCEPRRGFLAETLGLSIVRKAKQQQARDPGKRQNELLNVFLVAADPTDELKAGVMREKLAALAAVALTPSDPFDVTPDGITEAYRETNKKLAHAGGGQVDIVHLVAETAALPPNGEPGIVVGDNPGSRLDVDCSEVAGWLGASPSRLIVLHLRAPEGTSVADEHVQLLRVAESVSGGGAAANVLVLPFRASDDVGHGYLAQLYGQLAEGERLDAALRDVPRRLTRQWRNAMHSAAMYGFPAAYVHDPDVFAKPGEREPGNQDRADRGVPKLPGTGHSPGQQEPGQSTQAGSERRRTPIPDQGTIKWDGGQ